MLSQEAAAERLQALRVEKWEPAARRRAGKLPSQDGKAIRQLASLDPEKSNKSTLDWFKEQREHDERRADAAAYLDRLPKARRVASFAAVLPKLAEPMERAWQQLKSGPYIRWWHGFVVPFRAPNDSNATLVARGEWLSNVTSVLGPYNPDAAWVAAWAPHLSYYSANDPIGRLLAAVIDGEDDLAQAVKQTLIDSANGEHEIGSMGRHVTTAMMCSGDPACWEYVEKMLLAAQRQEGLRQVILESIDLAHPGAFRRMLGLLLEHNLARFASVVRAADVWFALRWDSASTGVVKQAFGRAVGYLDDPAARQAVIGGSEPEEAFMALWADAFEDATATVSKAAALLNHGDVAMRFTGAWMLSLLGLKASNDALLEALDDTDLRVINLGLSAVGPYLAGDTARESMNPSMFDRLVGLLDRTPKKTKKLKPLLWPWLESSIKASQVADILPDAASEADWSTMLDHIDKMSPHGRSHVVRLLKQRKRIEDRFRELLLRLTGDASSGVRGEAVDLLRRIELRGDEAEQLERLLTRKASDLRRGVLLLLVKQADRQAFGSAERLIASAVELQRRAGLEILRTLYTAKRCRKDCETAAKRYVDEHGPLPAEEQALVEPVLGIVKEKPSLSDGLGLVDTTGLPLPKPLLDKKVKLLSAAGFGYWKAIDDLIHTHRETPVTVVTWQGTEETTLLGNADRLHYSHAQSLQDREFPLADLWAKWYDDRPNSLRDKDGFEVWRALTRQAQWDSANEKMMYVNEKGKLSEEKLRYPVLVGNVIEHLAKQLEPAKSVEFLLDATETAMATTPPKTAVVELRLGGMALSWLEQIATHRRYFPATWTDPHLTRLIALKLWHDQPVDRKGRRLITRETVAAQHKVDKADYDAREKRGPYDRYYEARYELRKPIETELFGHAVRLGLVGENAAIAYIMGVGDRQGFEHDNHLRELTTQKDSPAVKACPTIRPIIDRAVERILEVELTRGEEPNASTLLAGKIRAVPGAGWLVKLLAALGDTAFLRGYSGTYFASGGEDRKSSFSRLVRACVPVEEDTPDRFADLVSEAGITEKRLIELAMFAPQWAGRVEHVLGWKGFESGVWWIHAHAKDSQWEVEQEVREAWMGTVGERTPLDARDLMDGAVDVAWFRSTYDALKKSKWDRIDAAAKNASSGGGHKRAQLFADAMLGRTKKAELVDRMMKKRYQDAVRALGLLPLARGKGRDKDLLDRYETIQEFVRSQRAQKMGSMRKNSEKRAVEIGLANLARTAGYPDPLRLQWAMEAKAVSDLADGAVAMSISPTTVALSITDAGEPEITVEKAGKALKTIPATIKKNKHVKELRDRKTALKRQSSRMRQSLEQMMCGGEVFNGEELVKLSAHPLMRPMLERLVFVGEGVFGYAAEGGRVLRDHAGDVESVKKNEKLRLAHPGDLLQLGDWAEWQRDCFTAERVQPFKQVFRELYVLTDTERAEKHGSRRYAGQQVNPRQAMALLGGRGWALQAEEGVRKTFHEHKLSVWLEFQEHFYTPAEVDGLTVESVRFSRPGEWKPMKLDEVPPLVFSEVMRDIDLVVSVAHRGGVDPEASASTVELRTDLLRETLPVLNVENVRLENNHALIDGEHAKYTVHLGSAVTHVLPGGSLIIVAVHSQHRGRLFLPFADDDPKTAEVMSKVLMLARDKQIKDPNLLDQIRRLG